MDKTRISQHFDQAAPIYDWVAAAQQQAANKLTALILEHTKHLSCTSLCDIGTGTGSMAQLLLEKIPSIRHVSLNDFANNMLQHAKNKISPLLNPAQQQLQLIHQDMDQLSLDTHDLIVSNMALQWSSQFEKTLDYLSNRSNIFAFSCLSEDTFKEWSDLFKQLNLPSPTFSYPSVAELTSLSHKISAAHGKSHVITHTQVIPMRFVSPRAFIHYLKNLGANTSNTANTDSQPNYKLSRQQWQMFLAQHQHEITVSYHLFFAVCF